MRITSILVTDFHGLPAATAHTDRPVTVLTGANGTGKSTLLRALNLMADAVRSGDRGLLEDLDREWATAGHNGAESFAVRIGIRFDAPDERALIDAFYRGAVISHLNAGTVGALELAAAVDTKLPDDPAVSMMTGELVVLMDRRQRSRWTVAWQFRLQGDLAHIQLLGPYMGSLVLGPVDIEPLGIMFYLGKSSASTNDLVQRISEGQEKIHFLEFRRGSRIEFEVAEVDAPVQPPSIATVLRETRHDRRPHSGVRFAAVLQSILSRRLQVTENHRSPIRTQFVLEELRVAPDLRDGSSLALELYRLKNGAAAERAEFAVIQQAFERLTGERVDCVQQVVEVNVNSEPGLSLMPVVQIDTSAGEIRDIPLHHAGAGAVEALLLATLLADRRRCVFLDEPAVHLSPTSQRRLLWMLRARREAPGQVLWITHNPDLVPVRDAEDLASILRMSKGGRGQSVNSLSLDAQSDFHSLARLLASTEVRSLLFAAGVVLFEGPTDLAAFARWLNRGVARGERLLPSPDERNVVFLSVDGQTAFGSFVGLAQRLDVPWVIVADGPAMRPGSRMAKQLERLGRVVPKSAQKLADIREEWAGQGVYSLADDFGDDGSKRGEIEAFLETVDANLLAQIRRDLGVEKGPRVGAAFADAVEPPLAVLDLWEALLTRLDPLH